MHNKVVYRMARGLRRAGVVALRFNFRGVGAERGQHAHLQGEIEDARAALAWLRERYPGPAFRPCRFLLRRARHHPPGCEIEEARWLMAAGFPTGTGPRNI